MNKNFKVLILYGVLALVFTWPLLPNITTQYPSTNLLQGGDPNMYIWFMDTMAQKVVNWDFNPSHMLFYPDGMNFLAGFEAPIILVVSTPVILLTHNPILAYNIILLLAFILTCYICYLLILHLTRSEYAAIICGFSFGFSEYMLVRGTQHIDLMLLFTVLWVILNAFKFVENPNKKNTLLLTLSVFITALSAWYYLVGVLIFLGLLFLFNLPKFMGAKKSYTIAGALVALAVLLPALPIIVNRSEMTLWHVAQSDQSFAADTLTFFIPHPYIHSWTWPIYVQFSPYEATSYFGLVGLIAIAVMLFFSKKIVIPHRGFWLTTLLVFLLLIMGKRIEIFNNVIAMPFEFLNNFMPFNRLRAPNRFFVFCYLVVTVFFGYFLAYIRNKFPNKSWKVIFTSLIVALLLLERFILSYPLFSPPVPEFYKTQGLSEEKYAIADIPFINPGVSLYNYYQIYHNKPITNGDYFWTAFNENTFSFLGSNALLTNSISAPCKVEASMNGVDRQKALKHLADINIRYVVVHNFIIHELKCPEVGEFIREFFAEKKPIFSDGEITVYETIDKSTQ